MKVIDILNKMSNGTLEDGFKFCFRNEVYTYRKKDDSIRDSCFNKIGGRNVIEDFLNNEVLLFKENDAKEVETIEENKEIEELDEMQIINARPEIKGDIDIDKYDVIFVGYPIWWSDMPMPVYTFLEAHQYEGKTIIPFCTHEGSGLANTENYLRNVCKGAEVLNGLAIRGRIAQNEQEKAKEEVENWLKEINIIK